MEDGEASAGRVVVVVELVMIEEGRILAKRFGFLLGEGEEFWSGEGGEGIVVGVWGKVVVVEGIVGKTVKGGRGKRLYEAVLLWHGSTEEEVLFTLEGRDDGVVGVLGGSGRALARESQRYRAEVFLMWPGSGRGAMMDTRLPVLSSCGVAGRGLHSGWSSMALGGGLPMVTLRIGKGLCNFPGFGGYIASSPGSKSVDVSVTDLALFGGCSSQPSFLVIAESGNCSGELVWLEKLVVVVRTELSSETDRSRRRSRLFTVDTEESVADPDAFRDACWCGIGGKAIGEMESPKGALFAGLVDALNKFGRLF